LIALKFGNSFGVGVCSLYYDPFCRSERRRADGQADGSGSNAVASAVFLFKSLASFPQFSLLRPGFPA
jgi:hypothetical protein